MIQLSHTDAKTIVRLLNLLVSTLQGDDASTADKRRIASRLTLKIEGKINSPSL